MITTSHSLIVGIEASDLVHRPHKTTDKKKNYNKNECEHVSILVNYKNYINSSVITLH